MATTHIISIHVGKGKTAHQSLKERLDYIMNPEKTDGGILISSHACSPETAADEFMLYRQEYLNTTGRKRKDEVLAYHARQAFKPGEITREKANEIGRALAERLTDKQHAFVVATHTDKQHIHNHIIFCATSLDGQQKYRDVKRSAKDLVQISDALCEENGLSVIRNPQDKAVPCDKWAGDLKKSSHRDDLRIMIDAALRHRPDGFDALLQMLEDAGCRIRRGAHISLKSPDGQRYIRLKSLGPEYDEDTLRQTLACDHVHIPKIPRADYSKSQVKRLVDIEDKLRNGKGKGYQVWAERNNIDAISQTVIFLKEHHIGSPEELEKQIDDLQSAYEEKKAFIRQAQNRMKEINCQRQAIRDYRRTKEIYTQFRESGWSAKFYQEHRAEIEAHKKAQAIYELLEGKLPTLKELTAEYAALKGQLDAYKPDLAELKSKLTDLKHIRYNYKILARDIPQTDQYHRKGERIEL